MQYFQCVLLNLDLFDSLEPLCGAVSLRLQTPGLKKGSSVGLTVILCW